MNALKAIALSAIVSGHSLAFAAPTPAPGIPQGTFGIHLFFSEKEYVDVLTIEKTGLGVKGRMDVPNDFVAPIHDFQHDGLGNFEFNVLVPKNSARPRDLIFHYAGKCYDRTCNQLIGFVNIAGQPPFVASFVGFKRSQPTHR